ncbi:helicase-associated domain-containing protein [Actinoplanes sp. NPDC051851]|uniref:helicase-associated domain-containing protein n=1 Tax=Actinoplanes sp. NPDC051851 TaxID=3154753 RepID=UPI00343C53E8
MSDVLQRSLAEHLAGLSGRQVAELIARRQPGGEQPLPTEPATLARRLLAPESVAGAVGLLALPHFQAAEAVTALGDRFTPGRLGALLGVPENDPGLREAIAGLSAVGLVWPQADGFAAAPLDVIWSEPLGLGPSAATLLEQYNQPKLRDLARRYGMRLPNGCTKAAAVAEVAGRLTDPGTVEKLIAEAPADVLRRLHEIAVRPPYPYGIAAFTFHSFQPEVPWATERGLMVPAIYGNGGQLAREVAITLRLAAGWHAPFDPEPPALVTTPVTADVVARDAAAAATETLAAITAVVEAVGQAPVALLKTGGLGVRELRRITKTSGQSEARTRLTLELITAGALLTSDENGLSVSGAYDDAYAVLGSAEQLLGTIETWLEMPASPLAEGTERLLYWDAEEEHLLIGVRAAFLRTLVKILPEDRAVTVDAVAGQIAWHLPVIGDTLGDYDLDRYVAGIWQETHALGLLAHGTPTPLCRRLLDGDPRPEAAALVPESRTTVVLQNDLTAVVTGTPAGTLLALLDGLATPESRSGAWTWRFSPASVLRAFDAGLSAEGLLAQLTTVAEGGRLPQALRYLIEDVARRHGQVQVRPVGCCLCSDDEALLTEILHTRSLGSLKLVRLAPTVLASGKPQDQTLVALRAAGFAPSGVRPDGTPKIERASRRRS